MKQVLVKKGQIIVEEVPAPMVDNNSVLVEVRYSLISTGTESAGISASRTSLIKKVLQTGNVKKGLNLIRNQGISKTIHKVKNQFESVQPIGYSCSGVVIDAGEHIKDIKIGERVACAGAGKAFHAEIVNVPRNLIVKIPDEVDFKDAASVTLGAITMQGVRRADPRLGDFIAVIGLGLIGQITAQILKAAGCRVIGIDIIKSRVELAKGLGMDYGVVIGEEDPVSAVIRFSNGYGADATIITAATKSNEPVEQAMEMTRKKGKVVVVGDVGLHLKRKSFYVKELDFLISTSYGPGRYDEQYEEKGIDYPYAYVRWTENRNMQEYLRMLDEGKVNFKALISNEYEIDDAPKAYRELRESEDKPLGVLLKYKQTETTAERRILVNPKPIKKEGIINVAVIGAGGFAQGMHLPNLDKLSKLYKIYAIVEKDGNKAKQVAIEYGASYCTTNYTEVLEDTNVDMIIIATRHNLHAPLAIEAARAGKAVFVEKPMALNKYELDELVKVLAETRVPFGVGFNRRFSPFANRIKDITFTRQSPMIINYRMNAGYIPLTNWVHTEEGGGRNIGEACHIYDLFNFLIDSEVASIEAKSITPNSEQYASNDNFIATIKYKDGSLCNLTYTALGSKDYPKEEMEIYVDGKIIKMLDYKKMEIFDKKHKVLQIKQDKGHLEELKAFYMSVSEGEEFIPFWQLLQAIEISFEVEKKISKQL